jgi:hypothetical protein
MSEHTPGPWYCHFGTAIAEQADGEYGYATGITTASEQEFSKDGGRGDLVAWVPWDAGTSDDDDPTAIANARLISASPALLAACKLALDVGLQDYVKFILAAAIAHAEGRDR